MEITEFGNGVPRILLIPGGPGLVPAFYAELTTQLAQNGRVITYTPRGTAPRRPDDFPLTMEEAATELEDIIVGVKESQSGRGSMEAAPLVLLGHSFGSAVAIEYLTTRGNDALVDAAILVSPFSSGGMIRNGIGERVRDLPQVFHRRYKGGAIPPEELVPLLGEYWYPNYLCRAPWPQSFLDAMTRLNPAFMEHFIGENLLDLDGELLSWDRTADLTNVSVPTLIVSGSHDYFRREDLELLRERIPRAELVISETASHSIWLEDPETFYSATDRLLATLSPDTP
ncbi:MAG: alpha/beta fold hydrolase [Alkalispirochaeta sp.]